MVQVSETVTEAPAAAAEPKLSKSRDTDWPAVLLFIHIHLLSLYGGYLLFYEVKFLTVVLFFALTMCAILGVTVGAHRLWAHRTYKASTGLRITLMLFQTLAGQGSIYEWVRHHRLHHAHYGTDADPHDHRKGFWYAHIITRMSKLSPYQEKLKQEIDMSDMDSDVVVTFQRNVYWLLYGVLFFLLPLNAPLEYWNDTVLSSVFVIGFLRYACVLHASWLIESGIHIWGLKEHEKYPLDSNIVFFLSKTFWPHYHYLSPCDYRSGEYGTYDSGCSTTFIRVFAALGLATDLKTVETAAVQESLALAMEKKLKVPQCLEEAVAKQVLPEDHYLHRQQI